MPKEHALLSASSAHRWLYCQRSARLEETLPDTTSGAAKEGTLAHALCELKLRHYFYTPDFGKRKYNAAVKKLQKDPLWQPEMDRYTDEYADYVKALAIAMPCAPAVRIEQRVDYSTYAPEGFGTADCLLIGGQTLTIIDFKYGKGVPVSAEGNPQLSLYALGAYEAYRILFDIKCVRLVVIQPRINNNSVWETSVEELLAFGEFVKPRAALAYSGGGEFKPSPETCRFCRAGATCRARSDHNVRQAFGIGEMPPTITDAEVGERLTALEDVVKYQKDLQAYALNRCLAGVEIPGWKAVEGRTVRAWSDQDAALDALVAGGVAQEVIYKREPLTLAQIEKEVGKSTLADLAGKYITRTAGKPTLAKASDTRAAITNKKTAKEAFKED